MCVFNAVDELHDDIFSALAWESSRLGLIEEIVREEYGLLSVCQDREPDFADVFKEHDGSEVGERMGVAFFWNQRHFTELPARWGNSAFPHFIRSCKEKLKDGFIEYFQCIDGDPGDTWGTAAIFGLDMLLEFYECDGCSECVGDFLQYSLVINFPFHVVKERFYILLELWR